MSTNSLEGGFVDAPVESAQAFRKIMNVMARPGLIEDLAVAAPPQPLSPAMGTLLLTLCDGQTSIFLAGEYDSAAVREWITFHCNAQFADAATCMFAIGNWSSLLPIDQYSIGTSQYPDRSATLIVEMDELTSHGQELSGPGIETVKHLSLPDTDAFQKNALLFPLGLDFYFTCGAKIAALPRTAKVIGIEEVA
ncbi:phosphonate C-P lyase system protein PhnH [Lentilitoribacter sp. EG35]|jgi:alpha-D-ribose 1-methylphosphonate 5-triphosphate synthase subunit PhnH|uniref:phosphonate C-P lyase system protein PhnH n=1 Tax=Lentilitoribacter sp. EG35 TaxID=3234192 RepID=UPI00346047D6